MSLKHYFEKGAVYYVTSVTYQRKKIFTDISTARFMLITIAYHKYILDFNLFGYVVMPDHIHLLLQPSEKADLPKIMKYIKGNFARKFNEWLLKDINDNIGSRRLNADYKKDSRGYYYIPVWQEGYYETVMMHDEKDAIIRLNYIHNNPVRKGLVESPEQYEFSSYHQYYGVARQKIQIPVDKLTVLQL